MQSIISSKKCVDSIFSRQKSAQAINAVLRAQKGGYRLFSGKASGCLDGQRDSQWRVSAKTLLRPIEQIVAGDTVWAWDEDLCEPVPKRVNCVFIKPSRPIFDIRYQTVGGNTASLRSTEEHPFWVVGKGWTPLIQLRPGDQLQLVDGGFASVDQVSATGHMEDVFNFEVDDIHNYFVGSAGVLVHNTSDPAQNGRPAFMVDASNAAHRQSTPVTSTLELPNGETGLITEHSDGRVDLGVVERTIAPAELNALGDKVVVMSIDKPGVKRVADSTPGDVVFVSDEGASGRYRVVSFDPSEGLQAGRTRSFEDRAAFDKYIEMKRAQYEAGRAERRARDDGRQTRANAAAEEWARKLELSFDRPGEIADKLFRADAPLGVDGASLWSRDIENQVLALKREQLRGGTTPVEGNAESIGLLEWRLEMWRASKRGEVLLKRGLVGEFDPTKWGMFYTSDSGAAINYAGAQLPAVNGTVVGLRIPKSDIGRFYMDTSGVSAVNPYADVYAIGENDLSPARQPRLLLSSNDPAQQWIFDRVQAFAKQGKGVSTAAELFNFVSTLEKGLVPKTAPAVEEPGISNLADASLGDYPEAVVSEQNGGNDVTEKTPMANTEPRMFGSVLGDVPSPSAARLARRIALAMALPAGGALAYSSLTPSSPSEVISSPVAPPHASSNEVISTPIESPRASYLDMAIPPNVASAPVAINFSSMQPAFDALWKISFPNGRSQESGGTFVSMPNNNNLVNLVNTHGGQSGNIFPSYNVGASLDVLGTFHTHPYDVSEGGHTGVSLSAGDFYEFTTNGKKIALAQSGDQQFMIMRTGETVDGLLESELRNKYNRDLVASRKLGFGVASQNAAAAMASRLGIAYYQGYDGVFSKFP